MLRRSNDILEFVKSLRQKKPDTAVSGESNPKDQRRRNERILARTLRPM
mgnify:CR=1 FL=1